MDMSFQIHAVVAVPCALWAFLTHWQKPAECLVEAIGLGGDTDTIASMTGALAGALHGQQWLPKSWYDGLENGEYGRDYCVALAKSLATLDLTGTLGTESADQNHEPAEVVTNNHDQ